MNKIVSFIVSLFIAAGVWLWIGSDGASKRIELDTDGITPFLIFWYMIWKLLHDKSRDE